MNKYILFIVLPLLLLAACFAISCMPFTRTTIASTTKSTDLTQPASPQKAQPATYDEGIVVRVVDGHTITLQIDGKTRTIRYIGIDTAMVYTCSKPLAFCSQASREQNSKLVEGKLVRLEKDISDEDRFGNLLRYVWIGDVMVNAELVNNGYAQAIGMPPDIKYYDLLLEMQQQAKLAGKGLWGTDDYVVRAPVPGMFVGDRTSMKYHEWNCELVKNIYDQNRMFFSSVANAIARGYLPCKLCKPPDKLCTQ